MKMIKIGSIVLGSLVLAHSAFAGFSSKFTVASDYVWRGVSLTNHGAAVQGGFDYDHDSGLGLGTWVSNVAINGGVENKVYGNYNHAVNDDLKVGVEAMWYNYPATALSTPYSNWTEFSLHASWQKMLDLNVYYANKFRRTDTSYMHYNLNASFDIPSDFTLGLGVGMTSYDDEVKAGWKNHANYLVSLGRTHEGMNLSLNWTNTNRKMKTALAETKVKDDALFVAMAKNF